MSTQTTENAAATAEAGLPVLDLAIAAPLSAGPQQVMDQQGNGSALYIGPGRVGIGTATPEVRLTVEGEHSIAQLRSLSGEANLQFTNAVDNVRWAIGSGGIESTPKDPTFFLWNDRTGTFSFVATPSILKLHKVHIPDLPVAPENHPFKAVVVDPVSGKLYRQP